MRINGTVIVPRRNSSPLTPVMHAHGISAEHTMCDAILVNSAHGDFLVTRGDWEEWTNHDPESRLDKPLWDTWSTRGDSVTWDDFHEVYIVSN